MKVIGFALFAAAMALASCAAPTRENIRPALIANLCAAEADVAEIIMKKRQAGVPQSEVLNSFHQSRTDSAAVVRRLVAAAYASPRTDDAAGAVDRFKKEQTARCLRVTH